MAKINKETLSRIEGMQYACDFAEKHGIEALKKEIAFRSNTKLPFTVDRQQVIDYQAYIKENVFSTLSLMSVLILREEFGFGSKRCARFVNKLRDNTEQLESKDLSWKDIYEAMIEEIGFDVNVNDEILNMEV